MANELTLPEPNDPSPLVPARREEYVPANDLERLAVHFVKSRMFKDLASVHQAVVRIKAGEELGLQPFQAMKSFDIIQGQVQMRGHGIASLIDDRPNYDYEVVELTDERCTIDFFKARGPSMVKRGTYTFTMKDAEKADLLKNPTYKKYPRAMLFNRCLSAGYKVFIPGATMGIPVYAEGEIGPPGVSDDGPTVEFVPAPKNVSPELSKRIEELEARIGPSARENVTPVTNDDEARIRIAKLETMAPSDK